MIDLENIPGAQIPEDSDENVNRAAIFNPWLKLNEFVKTGLAKLSKPGATNWDSGNLVIKPDVWKPEAPFIAEVRYARYFRLGPLVFIDGHINTKAMPTTSTDGAQIGGIPFYNTASGNSGISFHYYSGFNGALSGIVGATDNKIRITKNGEYLELKEMTFSTDLIFSGFLTID